MKSLLIILILALTTSNAVAGFRCGTKIIKEGDTLSRLVEVCGNPKTSYWAREDTGNRGQRYSAKVLNYIYARSGKQNMVVSIKDGKVIKIGVD